MKSKYESKETFLATLQIEDDFKNLIIYLEELELLKDNTKKRQGIKKHLINIVESILKQKQILAINCAAEYELLFNLKFENETKKM